jgi:hypothetical protein
MLNEVSMIRRMLYWIRVLLRSVFEIADLAAEMIVFLGMEILSLLNGRRDMSYQTRTAGCGTSNA